MKKAISVILALVMTFSAAFASYAADANVIIDGNYSVVIASPELLTSAEKFAEYLGSVCGKAPAVTDNYSSPCIYVEINPAKVADGYKIECAAPNVTISGSTLQQAVRGMYYFLEEYAGIKCYTSTLTVHKKESISVPDGLSYTYHPYFEYTETDWKSPRSVEYSLFNGLNGDDYRHIPDEFGGTIDYISSFCHTLSTQFCSKDKYFEEHPEYFAKYRGFQINSQLCLSNEKVYETVRDEVFEILKERHNPDVDLQIISLTQNDNIMYCTCNKCRATDMKYGSHAGTMLEFVNRIARDVKAAGYDNVALDTFAYRYTRKPPKGIVAEDNVIVRLCSIECCFSHALDDKNCPANADFMEDLAGWSKICNRLYVWDYCTNFCNYVGIYPDFGVLQRDIQLFAENNVRGLYEEGNYSLNLNSADTEFAELRAYLISKLMQNPYLDYEKTRNEFLDAYYGEGGKYIARFLNIITENAKKKHLGIYQSMFNTLDLKDNQIAVCDSLWQKAENETTGEAHTNVLNSELSWRYWKMNNLKSEFANPLTLSEKKAELTDDINSTGDVRWREMSDVKAFFCSIWQDLSLSVYPILKLVLGILYFVG